MGHEPVAPAYSHGRLEVGVAGQEDIHLPLGSIHRHPQQVRYIFTHELDLLHQPQPCVCCDLQARRTRPNSAPHSAEVKGALPEQGISHDMGLIELLSGV